MSAPIPSTKLSPTCNLFRCLICWKYIFPEDGVSIKGDGYVHTACGSRVSAYWKYHEYYTSYSKNRYHEDPELRKKYNEYSAAWRKKPENRKKIRDYQRKRYHEDPKYHEKVLAANREFYRKHGRIRKN